VCLIARAFFYAIINITLRIILFYYCNFILYGVIISLRIIFKGEIIMKKVLLTALFASIVSSQAMATVVAGPGVAYETQKTYDGNISLTREECLDKLEELDNKMYSVLVEGELTERQKTDLMTWMDSIDDLENSIESGTGCKEDF
jgi:hypothetical protein